MFLSVNPIFTVECLSLKICTSNRIVRSLYNKVINVDFKSILLEKPFDQV